MFAFGKRGLDVTFVAQYVLVGVTFVVEYVFTDVTFVVDMF